MTTSKYIPVNGEAQFSDVASSGRSKSVKTPNGDPIEGYYYVTSTSNKLEVDGRVIIITLQAVLPNSASNVAKGQNLVWDGVNYQVFAFTPRRYGRDIAHYELRCVQDERVY